MTARSNRNPALAAAALAVAIGLASAIPAGAAPRVSFSELLPAGPVYMLDTIIVTGCATPDSPARISDAYPVQWPEVPASQNVDAATSRIRLNLDSRGTLVAAAIADSSGNELLDEAALSAVRLSSYEPEVRKCTSLAAAYFVDVMFE